MKKLMLLTLSISSLCAMDNSKVDSADNSFKPIQSVQDIAAFAGYVVAYKTDSYYLGFPNQGYPIDEDKSVKYGYISRNTRSWSTQPWSNESSSGYKMTKLLKPTDIPNESALIDSKLKNKVFLVRNITKEEYKKIKDAINNDTAEFEYIFDKKTSLALLSDQ